MYEHVKTGCKHIPPSEQPLQFQSGYFLNKPRIYLKFCQPRRTCRTRNNGAVRWHNFYYRKSNRNYMFHCIQQPSSGRT